jgi:hypothetical protein
MNYLFNVLIGLTLGGMIVPLVGGVCILFLLFKRKQLNNGTASGLEQSEIMVLVILNVIGLMAIYDLPVVNVVVVGLLILLVYSTTNNLLKWVGALALIGQCAKLMLVYLEVEWFAMFTQITVVALAITTMIIRNWGQKLAQKS